MSIPPKFRLMRTQVSENKETYQLLNQNQPLFTLHYQPQTHTAEIHAADSRRIFRITREGFLKHKTVLRNEYGVRIGQVHYDKNHWEQGHIELYETEYRYRIDNSSVAELTIQEADADQTLVSCRINVDDKYTGLIFSKAEELVKDNYLAFVLALCWYICMPVGA